MSGRYSTSRWLRAIDLVTVVACVAPAASVFAEDLLGHVRVGTDGLSIEDAGAIVVFLEPADGHVATDEARLPTLAIRQQGASFEPDFLAVAVGQAIEMPNDDVIYHNVFSYSKPNDFDLGLYASGETHAVRFEHPGLVRIYCSIHDEMDGLIFVSPSRFHAVADAAGRYSIRDVPNGRYRVHVWSERLPEVVRSVDLEADRGRTVDLEIGRTTPAETQLGSVGSEER